MLKRLKEFFTFSADEMHNLILFSLFSFFILAITLVILILFLRWYYGV